MKDVLLIVKLCLKLFFDCFHLLIAAV